MAMLVDEITRRQNKLSNKVIESKFWNNVIEYVTFAMAASMVAFAGWQVWVQYFENSGSESKRCDS